VAQRITAIRKDRALWKRDMPIDHVYNRLTDFRLEEPAHTSIMLAYLAAGVVVSPHPRAHALSSRPNWLR